MLAIETQQPTEGETPDRNSMDERKLCGRLRGCNYAVDEPVKIGRCIVDQEHGGPKRGLAIRCGHLQDMANEQIDNPILEVPVLIHAQQQVLPPAPDQRDPDHQAERCAAAHDLARIKLTKFDLGGGTHESLQIRDVCTPR